VLFVLLANHSRVSNLRQLLMCALWVIYFQSWSLILAFLKISIMSDAPEYSRDQGDATFQTHNHTRYLDWYRSLHRYRAVGRVMAPGYTAELSADGAAVGKFVRCRAQRHGVYDHLASPAKLKHLDLRYENRYPWTYKEGESGGRSRILQVR
jgi:hypothetical protein